MRVTVLGCGIASGVPVIGPDWGDCDPKEPRNRRRRVSVLVDDGDGNGGPVLIDTSPDLREQLLDAGVGRVGAVVYTHGHADHVHGIDDVRSLNRRQRSVIPAYGTAETLAAIQERFAYVFEPPPRTADGRLAFYRPCLEPRLITHGQAFEAAGLSILPFEQDHGFSRTTGLRFGRAAYTTDAVALSDDAFDVLADLDLWIVDCIGYRPCPTHAHLERTLEWIARAKPKRAVLTHMGPEFDYQSLKAELPAGVEPGYDGMTIDL